MTDFASTVESWHDFYIMAGTAAATLMGLLFVATSLKLDFLADRANAETRARVTNSFEGFLYVLFFAMIFLIPDSDPESLGIPLFIFSVLRLFSVERRAWQAFVGRHLELRSRDNLVAYQLPAIAYLLVAGYTWPMVQGHPDTNGFGWFVGITLTLLGSATASAWRLMLVGDLTDSDADGGRDDTKERESRESRSDRELETDRLA